MLPDLFYSQSRAKPMSAQLGGTNALPSSRSRSRASDAGPSSGASEVDWVMHQHKLEMRSQSYSSHFRTLCAFLTTVPYLWSCGGSLRYPLDP